MIERHMETDVLVIGGGGAGFRAAIAAREAGARSLLVSKGPLARCGASPMAGADFTLDGSSMRELGRDGDPNDSREKVFNDIVTQGYYLNNQKLVEQYVHRAPRLLKDLMEWGLDIKTSDQRMVFTSGTHIMDLLLRKARSAGVDLIEDVMTLDLLIQDGAFAGALGLDVRTGEFVLIKAGAAVIASGGWHKAFWPNTGMRDLSGDGIAMAHRAGALIGNMEFVTFCCNIMFEPPMWVGSLAPYMLSLVCGGRLTNKDGEDIFTGYDPYIVGVGTSTEWNKSFVSQVTMKEVRAGRGCEHGGVLYSRGDVPWDFMGMVGGFFFPEWKYKAIDLSPWAKMLEENKPIEVGSAVEYFEGGIVIDEKFETGIEGLFAAGECTLGPFGSNRVFSAITEMLVHGFDAGTNAAHHAQKFLRHEPDSKVCSEIVSRYETLLNRRDGHKPASVRRMVQERAQRHLGPIRNAQELTDFTAFLTEVRRDIIPNLFASSKTRIYNKEWIDAIELENTLHLLEASARSALARSESRGVHFREDFPFTDNDTWFRESVVRMKDGTMEVASRPVSVLSMSPPQGTLPYLDMMKRMMQAHSDTGGKH